MDSLYFSKKRAQANRDFRNFQGNVDPSCRAFNEGTMFEEFDGFSGIASNKLRGFQNAAGGRKNRRPKAVGTIGAAARQVGGGRPFTTGITYGRETGGNVSCGGECTSGSIVGAVCDSGCICVNDSCVPARQVGGTTPVAARQTGGSTDCGGKCGHHWGISCPAGCRCSSTLNGTCEATRMGTTPNVRKTNFSSYTNFVNPSRGFRASANFNGGASRCALDR